MFEKGSMTYSLSSNFLIDITVDSPIFDDIKDSAGELFNEFLEKWEDSVALSARKQLFPIIVTDTIFDNFICLTRDGSLDLVSFKQL